MTDREKVLDKINNGKPVKAIQYVRLEHDSKLQRNNIWANNGTDLCRAFLAEHPNVALVEYPYVDCRYSTRNLRDRMGWVAMQCHLDDEDIDMVIVDDMHDMISSIADALETSFLFERPGLVVYEAKSMTLYDSSTPISMCLAC